MGRRPVQNPPPNCRPARPPGRRTERLDIHALFARLPSHRVPPRLRRISASASVLAFLSCLDILSQERHRRPPPGATSTVPGPG